MKRKRKELMVKLFEKTNPTPIKEENARKVVNLSTLSRGLSSRLGEDFNDENDMKIVGITGSKGKSTTAYFVHQYLKSQGYRSILYSSIEIDSPTSYDAEGEAVENPIRDERMLLDALVQAESYDADYLILEINERSIFRGYTKDIPFDVRFITNIIPHHNDSLYPPEQYVAIKKSFFENIPDDDNCICIHGIDEKVIFDSMKSLTNKPIRVFGSRYVANVRGIDENSIDYLLYPSNSPLDTLKGLNMAFRAGNNHYNLTTNILMPFNAINILGSIAILDVLGVYNNNRYQEMIGNIVIPGRNQKTVFNGRTILVSNHLIPELEILKTYKERGEFKRLVLVVGTSGEGYKTWVREFPDEVYHRERQKNLQFAYNYIKKHADYVYITTSDPAASDKDELLSRQASLLDGYLEYEKVDDRKLAIRKAIVNSQEGDLIYISGRANRRIFCETFNKLRLFRDQDVVEETLNDLSW